MGLDESQLVFSRQDGWGEADGVMFVELNEGSEEFELNISDDPEGGPKAKRPIANPDKFRSLCTNKSNQLGACLWEDGHHAGQGIEAHLDRIREIAHEGKKLFEALFEDDLILQVFRAWLKDNPRGRIKVTDNAHLIPWDLLYFEKDLPSADSIRHQGSAFAGFLGYDRFIYRPNWPTVSSKSQRKHRKKVHLAEGYDISAPDKLEKRFVEKGYSVTHLGLSTEAGAERFSMDMFADQWATYSDLIHMVGHFGKHPVHGVVGFQLLRDRIIDVDNIKERVSGLPLVFINACRSEGENTSLLTAIIEAADSRPPFDNPWCIVSPDIRVNVDAALRFQKEFYNFLLEGKSAHEAFMKSRYTILNDEKNPNPIGLAYGYHGIPNFYLSPQSEQLADAAK